MSRGASTGLPASTVQQVTDTIKERWANAPEVVVAAVWSRWWGLLVWRKC